MRSVYYLMLTALLLPVHCFVLRADEYILVDHTCTDLGRIPAWWVDQVKSNLHVAYQHTSHGSQLVTGMTALEQFPDFGSAFAWSDSGQPGTLDFDDDGIPGATPDLSQGDYIDGNGVTPWVTATRNLLDNPDNYHINVIMWSWCSINGHDISRYLTNMEILVSEYGVNGTNARAAEYPVDFVFMTGHAEGQGEGGFIYGANQQIRQHCRQKGRILFDFADIESYDPDGHYYYDLPMWDDLDYNPSRVNNWGVEWCSSNTGSQLEQLTTGNGVDGYAGCGNCAHSGSAANPETLNCVLKGRATWWMMARLAGWPGAPVAHATAPTNGAVEITWSSVCSGTVYEINRSSTLTGGWTNVARITNTSGNIEAAWSEPFPTNGSAFFYRLRQP